MKSDNIRLLCSEPSAEKLEAAIEPACEILDNIQAAFVKAKGVSEILKWTKSINDLKTQTVASRTIVGVVGSTGSGKSSIINAVLDEEDLVPTSSMRACTAVITEIAYNHSNEEKQEYRADIHFISTDEWMKELQVLFSDLNGETQYTMEHSNHDTEASIAMSKVRSVYPDICSRDLQSLEVTPKSLAKKPLVSSVLGTVKRLSAPNSKQLLDQVRTFIDSKEKNRDQGQKPLVMEYWPLVKVVKLFVKSRILETGLVLVDLPGVQDSNVARSAVAKSYIQQCAGLWIVAPVTRAVDDKSAQNLLGDAFKRQLLLDGTHSSVTFICSKTDDLSTTESLRVMGPAEPASQLHSQQRAAEKEFVKMKKDLTELESLIMEQDELMEQCNKNIDCLDAALSRAEDENVLLVSPSASRKRKPRQAALRPPKKPKKATSDFEDSNIDLNSDSDDDSDGFFTSQVDGEKEKLTRRDAILRLELLKSTRTSIFEERRNGSQKKKKLRKAMKETKTRSKELKSQAKSACVKHRNDYSRPTIQSQFSEGIRELDQDEAARKNEDEFDPEHEERDYKKLAEALPVFCVSSRAYQKLSGRLEKDEPALGFPNIEDTEIPALQNHAVNTAKSARAASWRMFFNDFWQYTISLMMQVVIADQPLRLADNLRVRELNFVNMSVDKLSQGLESAVKEAFLDCRENIKAKIYSKFQPAIEFASEKAPTTADTWGRHRDEGGLAYHTYRATCARDGVFKGAKGFKDFNEELCEPLKRHLGRRWEWVFATHLPAILDNLALDLVEKLKAFGHEMGERSILKKSTSYELAFAQNNNFALNIKETTPYKLLIQERQRAANREFTIAIANTMIATYLKCQGENGPGSFKRVKDHMTADIEKQREAMFRRATQRVKESVNISLDAVEVRFLKNVARIVHHIRDNFTSLVDDRNVFKVLENGHEDVRKILLNADSVFEGVYRVPISPIGPTPVALIADMGYNVSDRLAAMSVSGEVPATAAGVDGDVTMGNVGASSS
ncbi:hypothetical protein B0T25DRAFT_589476 [Lasiosphaeria hispida]|uniref:Nuclear GTPase SLIP-GC n=1 Tax=Lasiosphaeria hispida TaxID=260671 RepID=A0AAJ0MG41_9PEZI|nr:hypothetical protein B0T25DRAFT_589476 [Lasiosphaeria hispida]